MVTFNTLLNPYNDIGRLHNAGLDFIVKSIKQVRGPVSAELIATLAAEFVKINSISFGDAPLVTIKVQALTAMNYVILDRYPSGFSQEQIDFANDLNTIIDQFENVFENKAQIFAETEQLNRQIYESTLTEEEQGQILVGTAVIVNSIYYWEQVILTDNNDWKDYVDNSTPPNASLVIDWGAVAKADAKGAVKGGLTGLVTGGNILGGAAAGAVVASGVELADQILDQL